MSSRGVRSGETLVFRVVFIGFLLVCAASCTTVREATVYEKDGESITVEHGRFRGRWWNHYERGVALLGHGLYAEAEADFRAALAKRGRDQRWARTYGLHFLPEYFPNRELGIALYRQGQLEAGMESLERSVAQQHTARAAYFLSLAYRERVERANLDKAPPSFELTWASDPADRVSLVNEIKGVARDDTYVASVRIDGELVPIDLAAPEVTIQYPVLLSPGDNEFTVSVEDVLGNTTTEVVALRTDVTGPAVSFDATPARAGRVSGVAYDAAGVASMTIDGVPAILQDTGAGSVTFEAAPPDSREGAPVFVCMDKLGNATRGVVPGAQGESVQLGKALRVAMAGEGLPDAVSLASLIAAAQFDQVYHAANGDAAPEGPSIRFLDPIEGRIFTEPEIEVQVELKGRQPITLARLENKPLDLIPGRVEPQVVTSRILLEKTGRQPIHVSAVDAAGKETVATVEVEREESVVEQKAKLDAAFLGFGEKRLFGTARQDEDYPAIAATYVHRELDESGRFAHLGERDPVALAGALTEQQLSAALGSRAELLALRQVVPAEMIILGRLHVEPDNVELIIEGKTTETLGNQEVFTIVRADAAGPANTLEQLRELSRTLVFRFRQNLPRVKGEVALVEGQTIFTTLGKNYGVRPFQKLVVYKKGAPITHPSDPTKILKDGTTELLAEGYISTVEDMLSEAQILKLLEEAGGAPVERGQFVITK